MSFSYVIQDNYLAALGTPWLATNLVTINRVPRVGLVVGYSTSGLPLKIQFAGLPGYSYGVQRCTNLATGVWETVWNTTAPSTGCFTFEDANPPAPIVFYRLTNP